MKIKTVGETIANLRREKGLKQIELAEKSGISTAVLSRIERSRRDPKIEHLKCIAEAFEIPYQLLLLLSLDEKNVSEDKRESYRGIKSLLDDVI